jgi:hypothetical protein
LLLASAACAGLDLSGARRDAYGAFGPTRDATVVSPDGRPRPHLSAEAFAALRDRLRRDDGFRADRTRACAQELQRLWSADERAAWAADLDVEPAGAVRAYCERLNGAIVDGSLDYAGWLALTDPAGDPRERRRAVRALREAPAA